MNNRRGFTLVEFVFIAAVLATLLAMLAVVMVRAKARTLETGWPVGNTSNHGDEGQTVFYHVGHLKWNNSPEPDSGNDPDITIGGPAYEKSLINANLVRLVRLQRRGEAP